MPDRRRELDFIRTFGRFADALWDVEGVGAVVVDLSDADKLRVVSRFDGEELEGVRGCVEIVFRQTFNGVAPNSIIVKTLSGFMEDGERIFEDPRFVVQRKEGFGPEVKSDYLSEHRYISTHRIGWRRV